jgi:hypothetical protein
VSVGRAIVGADQYDEAHRFSVAEAVQSSAKKLAMPRRSISPRTVTLASSTSVAPIASTALTTAISVSGAPT